MRTPGKEGQLTQVLAVVAQSDPQFAAAFVELVLRVAHSDSRHRANVQLMGSPPKELTCRAEHSVYDEYDLGLGRVDLRFDGGDDFTLFVENKLYAGFGAAQLARYQAALKVLPDERKRAGLLAITRDVPSHGELDAGSAGWLGAIRWARLYDEGLRDLPIYDDDVALQWRLLVDILHDQGDLGLTAVNSDLILAWSRYEEGQHHLADILLDVRQKTLDLLRDALATKHRRMRDRDDIAGLHFFGAVEAVPVKLQKGVVWTGFRVPAGINRPAVSLHIFAADSGRPTFSVEVRPWQAARRLDDGEAQLLGAARKLSKQGFQSALYNHEQVWWTEYGPEAYLDADDVPAKLIEFIEKDVEAIVGSGILKHDLEAAEKGGRGGPPRVGARRRR
jgi:hypothetical protein